MGSEALGIANEREGMRPADRMDVQNNFKGWRVGQVFPSMSCQDACLQALTDGMLETFDPVTGGIIPIPKP
jgi:hypothetical protein